MTLVSELDNAVASVLAHPYLAGGVSAATALFFLYKHLAWSPTHKNGIPLPPGPPAKWFWEDALPKNDVPHSLAALVDQYGPVISLRRGAHVTVIIGRMDAATEIMEKEGGYLVDRPLIISATELLSNRMRLLLEPAGDRFRRLRRAAHIHLQPKAAQDYEDIQLAAAKDLILDILNDPKGHMQHADRYATVVILRLTYGKTSPTSSDDPDMVRINQVLVNIQSTMKPGAYLVDSIPWLKYIPGYGRKLREFHRYELSLFRDQLNRVKADMEANRAFPSFGKTILEKTTEHQLSFDEMAYLGGALYSAGADTTAVGIQVMIMAAACYPDAQARVQVQLDEVVGRDRAPSFEDWNMLPQVKAFILESMRWIPVALTGFGHRATKDIIWRGQCIPAGATVTGPHWVISRDPIAFPNPDVFNPKRWLTEDGQIKADMQFFTYGFGRRVCPGQHVANRSLYITLSLLLWAFHIQQRPEAPIILNADDFRNPFVFHPRPFEVNFVLRVDKEQLKKLIA